MSYFLIANCAQNRHMGLVFYKVINKRIGELSELGQVKNRFMNSKFLHYALPPDIRCRTQYGVSKFYDRLFNV